MLFMVILLKCLVIFDLFIHPTVKTISKQETWLQSISFTVWVQDSVSLVHVGGSCLTCRSTPSSMAGFTLWLLCPPWFPMSQNAHIHGTDDLATMKVEDVCSCTWSFYWLLNNDTSSLILPLYYFRITVEIFYKKKQPLWWSHLFCMGPQFYCSVRFHYKSGNICPTDSCHSHQSGLWRYPGQLSSAVMNLFSFCLSSLVWIGFGIGKKREGNTSASRFIPEILLKSQSCQTCPINRWQPKHWKPKETTHHDKSVNPFWGIWIILTLQTGGDWTWMETGKMIFLGIGLLIYWQKKWCMYFLNYWFFR